jgi:hypothetical protein
MTWSWKKQEIAIRNISNSDYYLVSSSKRLWQNIEYLEAEWSFQDVVNFIDKVDYTIALLVKNIEFISPESKNVNKVVITKQITLYYKINSNTIDYFDFGIHTKI